MELRLIILLNASTTSEVYHFSFFISLIANSKLCFSLYILLELMASKELAKAIILAYDGISSLFSPFG